VDPLATILRFFSTKQSVKKYFVCVTAFFVTFLGLIFLIQSMSYQNINDLSFNQTAELQKVFLNYSQEQISRLANSFSKIFYNNFFGSIYILVLSTVIFSIVSILGFFVSTSKDINLKFSSLLSKIFLLFYYMFKYVAVTFGNLYFFYILPLPVFLISYAHGIFEIPAMILSFTFSLALADDVRDILTQSCFSEAEIKIKIWMMNFLKYFIILAIVLFIAAFFETQITPNLIRASFEDYFQTA